MAITRSALKQVTQAVLSRAPETKLRAVGGDDGHASLASACWRFKSATATATVTAAVVVIAEMQAMPHERKQVWYVK